MGTILFGIAGLGLADGVGKGLDWGKLGRNAMENGMPDKVVKSLKGWLRSVQLDGVKIGPRWANANISFEDLDKDAAWELYIELLTRITTQPLRDKEGDEETALSSVFAIFGLTREVLKRKGRKAEHFAKIAIPVLNQVIRPFTAKWHAISEKESFGNEGRRAEFRAELRELQEELRKYNRLLADIAEVEDLTDLEEGS